MSATILCVDDDELVLLAVEELLRTEGYDVVTAPRGPAALEILKDRTFDLMIFDVVMPEMSGYELCEKVRAMESFSDTPIIMLTARSGEDDRKRGMEAGATMYLPKPIAPTKLINLVASILRAG